MGQYLSEQINLMVKPIGNWEKLFRLLKKYTLVNKSLISMHMLSQILQMISFMISRATAKWEATQKTNKKRVFLLRILYGQILYLPQQVLF